MHRRIALVKTGWSEQYQGGLLARHRKTGDELHVEVKGTSGVNMG